MSDQLTGPARLAGDRYHGEINAWFGAPNDRVTGAAAAFLEACLKDPGRGPAIP